MCRESLYAVWTSHAKSDAELHRVQRLILAMPTVHVIRQCHTHKLSKWKQRSLSQAVQQATVQSSASSYQPRWSRMVWAYKAEVHGQDFCKGRFYQAVLIRVLRGCRLLRRHRRRHCCFALTMADHELAWVCQHTAQSPKTDSAQADDAVVRKGQIVVMVPSSMMLRSTVNEGSKTSPRCHVLSTTKISLAVLK